MSSAQEGGCTVSEDHQTTASQADATGEQQLARNHGFADGNKRTAWVMARLFIADHGHGLRFEPLDAIRLMEGVAAKTITEKQLAEWFRKRIFLEWTSESKSITATTRILS